MNPLPIVWADLRRNRVGAVAIVVLVALAVALGVAVTAQSRALQQGSTRAADPFDLLIAAPGSETQLVLSAIYLQPASLDLLPGAVLAELQNDPRARFAAPIGFGDSYRGHPIVGVTPDLVAHLAGAGGGKVEGATLAHLTDAVLGSKVALDLGQSFVPMHGMAAFDDDEEAHEGFDYVAVGRLPPLGSPWDQAILVPIEAVWFVHALPLGHGQDAVNVAQDHEHAHPADLPDVPIGGPFDAERTPGVPAIVVEPTSVADAYRLRQAYRARPDTTALFPAEVLIRLYGLLGDARDLLAVIAVLTQTLVIAAVLLAVLASLGQRRRLIGVLRALGASGGFVFLAVWSGVALTLTLGSALGLGLGYALAAALAAAFSSETGIALRVGIGLPELRLLLAVVLIGMALAAVPALLAYRRPVAAALRG